jgi:predicted ArsR family transcriptional regulator
MKSGNDEPSEETSDKILAIIQSDTRTTARHMANVLGLSSRAVEMQLAKLSRLEGSNGLAPRKVATGRREGIDGDSDWRDYPENCPDNYPENPG